MVTKDMTATSANQCTYLADMQSPLLASLPPVCLIAAAPAAVIPATYGATTYWFFESCIGFGSIKMGVPGAVSQTFFVSPIPVFRKIIQDQSVGKLPLLPYSSMFVNGIFWFSYGLLIGNPAVWVTNVPPIIFGATYTAIFCKYCPADAAWLPYTRGYHLAGMAFAVCFVGGLVSTQDPAVASSVIGSVAVGMCVVMFSGPLAALRTVLQQKSTKSLPFPMMIATVANCSLWTFYGVELVHDPFIWGPNPLGLLSGLAQAILFMRFGIAR